jgi:hypothetical protein
MSINVKYTRNGTVVFCLSIKRFSNPGILQILMTIFCSCQRYWFSFHSSCWLLQLLFFAITGKVNQFGDNTTGLMTRIWFPAGSGTYLSSSPLSDRLWGSSSLLTNGYRELSPRGQSGRGVKLIAHLHLVTRLKMRGTITQLPHTSSWCGV